MRAKLCSYKHYGSSLKRSSRGIQLEEESRANCTNGGVEKQTLGSRVCSGYRIYSMIMI